METIAKSVWSFTQNYTVLERNTLKYRPHLDTSHTFGVMQTIEITLAFPLNGPTIRRTSYTRWPKYHIQRNRLNFEIAKYA